jgi:hypothetical protein
MANTKISALTPGAPALATDLFPIDRSGANFSLKTSDILALTTSAADPTNEPGFFPTQFGTATSGLGSVASGQTTLQTGGSALVAIRVVLPFPITVSRATMTVSAGLASQHFGVAIYNIAGTTKLIEWDFDGSSATTQTLNTTAVLLPAGEYWFAWASTSASVTVVAYNTNNVIPTITQKTNLHFVSCSGVYSSGMPTAMGTLAAVASSANVPLVFIEQ